MIKKVAMNKNEIYSLLRMNKYEDAIQQLNDQRKKIEDTAIEIVDKYISNEIILLEERETFINIIQKDINDKLIKDYSYVLMDEVKINTINEKIHQLRKVKSLSKTS